MNLIKLRKYWYLISLLVIVPGLISLAVKGLNLGIDFRGGSYIELKFKKAVESGDVLPVLEDVGVE
ncbi:MAG: preprotein translocase subunit SecF, partial [Thermacetogenium sp.]|nr:preprotein translocase subunit SecF [Thermacetogenium sp.]